MPPIHGHCDERFAPVRDVFIRNLESGDDVGASVSLIVDGETVVDLWGGWTDESRATEWAEDTLVPVHSTSKTMVALCALILVERGLLDPYAPVTTYWPEFGQAGKEDIRVRHLMSHTSGLSGWAQPVQPDDIYNWDKAIAMLSAQEPWWEPGTASGYHLLSYNHLVGELVRRVSGMPMADFFDKEIGGPLGLDYHFGVNPTMEHRLAPMIPVENPVFDFASLDPASVMMKTFTGPFLLGYAKNMELQAKRFPMNGFANARSIARAQAVVSHGGSYGGLDPSPLRRSTRSSTCSPMGPTSCSACPSVSASATRCPAPPGRACPVAGPAGGPAWGDRASSTRWSTGQRSGTR